MNDFTKEELKHIGDALFYSMSILDTRKDALMDIRGKVLEMIEDYCEHEASTPLMALVKECGKCHDYIDHRRWELSEEWKK